MKTIIRARRGSLRRVVKTKDITIPDCWHAYEWLEEKGEKQFASDVLECWNLCHDLLEAVMEG